MMVPTDPPDTQFMPPQVAASQQETFHGSLLDIPNGGGVPQRMQGDKDQDPMQEEDSEDLAGTKKPACELPPLGGHLTA